MAYSFVKTFGSGEAYDIIAEEIQGTVFFAGEVHILTSNPILLFIFSKNGSVLKPKSSMFECLVTAHGRSPVHSESLPYISPSSHF